jgi:hypothetical protein
MRAKLGFCLVAACLIGWIAYSRVVTDDLPGRTVGASSAIDTEVEIATSPADVVERMRKSSEEGRTVRVEYHASPGASGQQPELWCRSLTDGERMRAARQMDRLRQASDNAIARTEGDPVEVELKRARGLRNRAMVDAAATLLAEGGGFLTKGIATGLMSDSEWHYWNMSFHTAEEGDLLLYVPISLVRFTDVGPRKANAAAMAEVAAGERGYQWNSRDFEERRRLVDAAVRAKLRYPELEREVAALKAAGDLGPGQPESLRRLLEEMQVLRDAIALVPAGYEEGTLEYRAK